ncbi:MAG: DNA double-strand break repair nuclease NurA [Desulfurococcales archaeon]|nr:DNA double-strand break repair nuclease NurA [Desulfurococcales archaeon]
MARGDWFLDLFTSEAEKLLEGLGEARGAVEPPRYWWVPGLPEAGDPPPAVAAVDGGGGVIDLGSRGAVYVARAFGYVEEGEPDRLLDMRFYATRDSRVLDALRTWVEHRVASRLALRLPPGSIVLMDGSYWVTVTAAFTALAKLASGRVSSLASVYTGVLSGHALAEIARAAEIARSRGVRIAYVSKDHGLRALKEKVLLDEVSRAVPAVSELVRRSLEWYPLRGRDALLEARRLLPDRLKPLLEAALDPAYRDPVFVDDAVGRTPGYSWVLRLPPPRRLSLAISQGGPAALAERAAEKAVSILGPGGPGAAEAEALREKLPRLLDQLPAARMGYVRLSPGDGLLLVEEPGEPGGYYSPGRVLEPPGSGWSWLVALLASQYSGPEYYNIPLIAAHLNATLSSDQLERYARLLESLAAARGLELRRARRAAIAGRLSRRRRRRHSPI